MMEMFRSKARQHHTVRRSRCRARTTSERSPPAGQFLHRLEGAARQDAFGPCLGDVLQAEQITARRLVDVDCPDGNRLLSQPGGLCAGRLSPDYS
jgi:hypothetical protein